tara:strand:+ start:9635 stop:10639 length:1005 start_codon:yes stop_codon:yes gene_type:complete
MAFLDNSGDIILDAVLTATGRKKMSQGNGSFKIVKFALGDDEIDYSLYNLNTGSAYQDLEIMQTPVFEAFTQANANINYGLMSLTRPDLLYLPELLTNEKVSVAAKLTGSIYYLGVNSETTTKLNSAVGNTYRLQSGQTSDQAIIIESMLNTGPSDGLVGSKANRQSYILNTNLNDEKYEIDIDNRFVAGVLGPADTAQFLNDSDGRSTIKLTPLRGSVATSRTAALTNYTQYIIRGVPNRVYYYGGGGADTDISAGSGPRGSTTAINFSVNPDLVATSTGVRSTKYALYGAINQTLFGGSDLYDYIDFTCYIKGAQSSATIQLPIRIIRYAGT